MHKHNKFQVDYYKNKAKEYDNRKTGYLRDNRNHQKKIKHILKILQPSAKAKVLEIGAGTGIHAGYFMNEFPHADYYGVDISPHMLTIARKHLPKIKKTLQAAEAEDLPYKANTFDHVYISGTLHHVSDQQKAVKELLRVLKPGGTFFIMEPNYIHPVNLIPAHTIPVEKNMRLMTRRNLHRWLKKAPAAKIRIYNFIYTPPFPTQLHKLFDIIDTITPTLVFLSYASIMLCATGTKTHTK